MASFERQVCCDLAKHLRQERTACRR
jgi:hypothetical protein